ncbi:MAG: YwiC-like family protein [Chloroflexi bacterium]|nr:YwiC-like family protein [Chloroflexota bacterium]
MARTMEKKAQPRFRKQILIPAEHGSWSWLFVPYLVGVGVAGTYSLATFLVLAAGLSVFLMRQPGMVMSRARTGRGRRSDGPIAARILVILSLTAVLSLAGLLLLGVSDILWLTIPAVVVVVLYLTASTSRHTSVRILWMEIVGAAGLALMAPAVMIAADGRITPAAWSVFFLMAWQNILSVFYVRQRIADTHQRDGSRVSSLLGSVVGVTAVIAAAVLGYVPWLAILPFLAFLLRAIWTYHKSRPIPVIKKFGFTEVGVQLIVGFVIVVSYWL